MIAPSRSVAVCAQAISDIGRLRMKTRAARAAAVAGLALLLGIVTAGPADAHAVLVATTPQAGYTSVRGPDRVVLTFDEPVSDPSVRVTRSGHSVALHRPQGAGRQVIVSPARALPTGSYTVDWQVTASDGDVVTGSFGFGIGAPAPTSKPHAGTAGLPAAIVLRWLLFAGLSLLAGGLVAEWALRYRGVDLPRPDPPLRTGAALGLLGAFGLVAHLMGAGSLRGGLGHPRLHLLVAKSAGRIALTELSAFVIALLVPRRARPVLVVPVLAVLIAEGLRSHVHGRADGFGAPLLVLHLAAAAIWVGALLHTVRVGVAWRGQRRALRELIGTYARLALWLLVVAVASGTVAAIVLLPSLASLVNSGYGQVLLAKMLLVAGAMGLAAIARRSIQGDGDPPVHWPTVRAETVELTAILAVTAALVSLPLPTGPATFAAPPPAPTGPVVAVGTLAGQVTVSAQAAAGQLLVRLTVPDDVSGKTTPRYRLTAALAGRSLAATSCGTGCFIATPTWRSGDNQLRLAVTATGWHGGTATLHLPWPPRPESRILGRVIAAMRAVPTLIDAEQVTSDTSRPTPAAAPLRLRGTAFIATEPYGTGGPAGNLTAGPRPGTRRLLLAYPAQGYYVDLTINAADRVVTETISAPAHLIIRQFRYPHR